MFAPAYWYEERNGRYDNEIFKINEEIFWKGL
jgi:hypothetical protein